MSEGALLAEDYFHIPYLLMIWSTVGPDGNWLRHAEYPELPGCVVEAEDTVEALERLEELRVEYILSCQTRGEQVPVPRPPLRA